MKSSITESIKSLPPLSKTVADINALFANKESSVHDLIKVIEPDPMVVANLLKAANSPLYGFGKEIKNVSQAVNLFGMDLTRALALENSIRKLLNIDMQPYGVTSEKFAEISTWQAILAHKWYKKINPVKADKLYLAAFLQETGKIVLANEIIKDDEMTSFSSEIKNTNNIAQVEKAYLDVTSAQVTAKIFEHWGFEKEFVEMIQHSDIPANAPSEIREFSIALNIIKTVIPINRPLEESAINFGLKKANDAGYDHEMLEDAIDEMLDVIEGKE
ncbi:MAG: HDOD domain-containing protein [Sulfurimonadaceae bacterium]|jgi:HD-like signal output (HDOD) protein|nr:HDOD domain-containing protein [Sulfurimonadaceae bacterium]